MDRELIDSAWRVLPAEFKRVVKAHYAGLNAAYKAYLSKDSLTNEECDRCKAIREKISIYSMYFGHHNLTSDAEGEEDEMLYVSRKRVQDTYAQCKTVQMDDSPNLPAETIEAASTIKALLRSLFGSKCLPDEETNDADFKVPEPNCKHFKNGKCAHPSVSHLENGKLVKGIECDVSSCEDVEYEPNPAEPKFKVEDEVVWDKRIIAYVDEILNDGDYIIYSRVGNRYTVHESDLEPYNEPGKEAAKMKPIESKVSVYLATKEEDEEFRQLLHRNGFTWHTNAPLINLTCWVSDFEDSKIHYIHPDKTVTYCGERTENTLTFTEFKKQYFGEDVNLSQNTTNCGKQFDNILKDSFLKERRLNIATQIMSGILSNQRMLNNLASGETTTDGVVMRIVDATMMYTDALIAESEKGVNHA